MGLFTPERPYTAVTAIINKIIENHTGEIDDGSMELELPELLESIKIQSSGATEAARAIRKKLKYGSDKEKLNALQIFELLVANGGKRLSPMYNDSNLLDRFSTIVTDKGINPKVRKQAILMVIGWHDEYQGSSTHKGLTNLHDRLPMNKYVKKKKQNSINNFMDDEADDSTPFEVIGGGTNTNPGRSDDDEEEEEAENESEFYSSRNFRSKKLPPLNKSLSSKNASRKKTNQEINREYKIPRINYVKEKPKMNQLIADSTSNSTKLLNMLQSLRPNENPVENTKCYDTFVKCRDLRRKILRYLQLVDHEEFLAPLIHANEELIDALQKYSREAERFTEQDSDDDDDDFGDDDDDASAYTRTDYSTSSDELSSVSESIHDINIGKRKPPPPPIPPKSAALKSQLKQQQLRGNNNVIIDDTDDDDDPFGDSKKTEYPVAWS